MYNRLGISCAMMALAACTTIGNKFDPERVSQLTPGVSTIADATALLGTPSSRSPSANGSTLLQWIYSQGTLFGGNGGHVAILFGADGRMLRVTHQFRT